MESTIEEVNIKEINQKAISLVDQARTVRITNDDECKAANELYKIADEMEKQALAILEPIKDKAHKAWKEVCNQINITCEPFKRAKQIIKPLIIAYNEAKEKARREEEAKIREELRKKEEEVRLAEAQAYEAMGDKETAEAIISDPITAPSITLPKTKIADTPRYAEYWSAEVYDLAALVKAAGTGKIPLETIQPNMIMLNAQARTLKSAFNWPGVRAKSEKK